MGQTMLQQHINSRLPWLNTSTYFLLTSVGTLSWWFAKPWPTGPGCRHSANSLYICQQEEKRWSIMATAGEGSEFYCQIWKSRRSLVPTCHWPRTNCDRGWAEVRATLRIFATTLYCCPSTSGRKDRLSNVRPCLALHASVRGFRM